MHGQVIPHTSSHDGAQHARQTTSRHRPLMAAMLLSLVALMHAGGCSRREPASPPPQPARQPALRVLVAEDSALAQALTRLRGAWREAGGGELAVSECPAVDLAQAAAQADVVIYPVRQQGMLAEQGLLDTLSRHQQESGEAAWTDILESLRVKQLIWGEDTVAVPLGLPVFTCMYRSKLLKERGLSTPRTWAELSRAAAALQSQPPAEHPPEEGTWHAVLLPLAEGWAGLTFLCHAAAYVRHRDQYSDLFDLDSFDPLIAGPPFVKALQELAELAAPARLRNLELTPTAAFQAVCRGECALALGWPAPVRARAAHATLEVPVDLEFAEAPGADAAYNHSTREWDARLPEESVHVTLLGAEGRLGSAVKGRAHATAAWEFLLWLSGPRWSERAAASSAGTTLFRGSHLRSPGGWVDEMRPAAARSYAQALEASLTLRPVMLAPRLPGAERYLAALDRAVRAVVNGEQKPRAALRTTADQWRQITQELGLAAQKRAYHASLGLPPGVE